MDLARRLNRHPLPTLLHQGGRLLSFVLVIALAAACRQASDQPNFPQADREVAPIVSDAFSTEDARDRLGEAEQVIQLARVAPGMSVADIGAGEGYYTVRLAPAVGRRGRVLAEDIVPEVEERLVQRVHRENLDNVAVKLGKDDDPKLPPRSFDRIFLVHVYHEVTSPYEFLWNMREGLKADGEVIVVDADRPPKRHGMPPKLLQCEFAAVGLKMTRLERLAGGESYFASFRLAGPRPDPAQIKPCQYKA